MLEFILKPRRLIVLFLASQNNREQQRAIEYPQVENQVLREKLGKGRILLNDDQRRRLAVKGKVLGRKVLRELANCGNGSLVETRRACWGWRKRFVRRPLKDQVAFA